MKKININIEQLSDGNNLGFCAKIKENNKTTAIVMADSIKEIFKMIPITMKTNFLAQEKYKKTQAKIN